MRSLARLAATAALLFAMATVALAQSDLRALIADLATGGYDTTEQAISALATTGDSAAIPALEALGTGDLYLRKADGAVVIGRTISRSEIELSDPLTGDRLGSETAGALDRIRVNNRLRRAVQSAVGSLTLMSADPARRLAAAQTALAAADPGAIETIEAALAKEKDRSIRGVLQAARAAAILASDRPAETKIEAVAVITAHGDRGALAVLTPLVSSADARIASAAAASVERIERRLAMWEAGQNVWYGISLGSVLFLAAIGLAITFGVMGVINMAHGEMVMLGAYTTFVVQEIIRNSAPWLFDWSLAIALPLAFLVAGTAGLVIERSVIRWLYGRPLETLLATWGLALILQQAVRSLFGPTNRQVGNPSWMSGSFELGGLSIGTGRMWIVLFALVVFAALALAVRYTSFGLQMRAVTQNRRMAASMGIRTPWVDALTFALGSGIAGIAGVALSQIGNVSPNLGQLYIVDSFMVVVFGGVGNIWGTLLGALTLGIVNKFLEPYAGAVLAKILVLVVVILFIQKRPRGLFALRGRAAEA